jgi:hypothetical protein
MRTALMNILNTMDVPENRKTDWNWLSRNLAIRNKDHKDFNLAIELLRKILKEKFEENHNNHCSNF